VRLRGACGIFGHHLTLQANDNAGNTTQDAVEVTVDLLC